MERMVRRAGLHSLGCERTQRTLPYRELEHVRRELEAKRGDLNGHRDAEGSVANRLSGPGRVKQVQKNRPALFRGRHFEDEVIILCVRWYLRYSLSYRDLKEMMAERGLAVDHSTEWRWVQRDAPI